jgi:broad specificity phosphatase PhoE
VTASIDLAHSSWLGNLVGVTSPPRGTPSFTLVRHGESEWNAERLVQGQNDTAHLTPRGRDQAREVAESLRDMGFTLLIASDLRRAYETATIIGGAIGLEPITQPLLRERCFGVYEGRPVDELSSELTGHADGVVFDGDARPPDGESLRDVVARASEFIETTTSELPDERILVVSHGGMINGLRLSSAGEPLEGQSWYRVTNCQVWTLDEPLDLSTSRP